MNSITHITKFSNITIAYNLLFIFTDVKFSYIANGNSRLNAAPNNQPIQRNTVHFRKKKTGNNQFNSINENALLMPNSNLPFKLFSFQCAIDGMQVFIEHTVRTYLVLIFGVSSGV